MKKNVKLIALMLAMLMVLPMLAPMMAFDVAAATEEEVTTGWDGVTVATKFQKGTGAKNNPWRISTPEQLAYMAKVLNDPETAAAYYKDYFVLTADIDLGGKEWTPISNVSYNGANGLKRFQGSFDGGGFTISNFYIGECKEAGTGLFGITSGATIKNLTLQGRVEAGAIYNTTTAAPGAAMLAPAMFDTTVTNVTIYADMDIKRNEYASGPLYIGAFCGYTGLTSNPTTFTNCHSYGTITVSCANGDYTTVGGILSHSKAVKVIECSSNVDINVKTGNNAGVLVGGILGDSYSDYNAPATHTSTITGSAFTGSINVVTPKNASIGGIVGTAGRGTSSSENGLKSGGTMTITNCFVDASLNVKAENSGGWVYKGSIVGLMRPTYGTIEACFTSLECALYNLDPKLADYYGNGLTFTDKGGHMTGIGIQSEFGAGVRLTYGSTGLRFNSMIDRDLYDALTARTDITVQLGTLIAPTTYVEGAEGFTFERLTAYQKKMGHSAAYLDVPFDPAVNSWLDPYFKNAEKDNLHYFSGAITNILETNYNRAFSGVGYLTITTTKGYTYTFYGDYTDASRSRTVSYVATRALDDLSDTKDNEKYIYETEEGKYSPYSETKRERLDGFAVKFDASTVDTSNIKLIENNKSDYAIVYPLGADAKDRDLAIYLQHAIKQITGVTLPVYESYVKADADAKEIVVGCSSRAGVYQFNMNSLESGYRIFTANERIVILGDTAQSLGVAIRAFVKSFLGVDLAETVPTTQKGSTISIPRNLVMTKNDVALKPLNVDLSAFKITYADETEMRAAYALRDAIALATGGKLEYYTYTASGKNYADRTLTGGTQLAVSSVASGTRIQFVTNASITEGDFRISTSVANELTVITVEAGSYYGFEGAKDYLVAEMTYGIARLTDNGFEMSGNYKYWLSHLEESSKYAYDIEEYEIRVMFYNVLFGTSASTGGSLTADLPREERNRLEANMIAQYMPDVLGCQEFNVSKRSDAGEYNLVTLLSKLGYVEAVDPIVDNASNSNYWRSAVRDSNGKLLGYTVKTNSNGGGTTLGILDQIKYGFKRTFYNNDPLFYNKNTTDLLAAGYYWFENQWELGEEVQDEYGHYYKSTHENGASDCGSKSATWGLFRDKNTGEQYIVVSTHMCTRNDNIRGLQARELVTLIASLIETYDAPVFLGGDMNGQVTSQNIRYFLDEARYTDAVLHNVATEFTSHIYTAHSYPDRDTVDEGVTLMQPSSLENTYFSDNSIDRIFLANHDEIEVHVFGVISDDCSRSASDHYPIFMDFCFKSSIPEPPKEPVKPIWSNRY